MPMGGMHLFHNDLVHVNNAFLILFWVAKDSPSSHKVLLPLFYFALATSQVLISEGYYVPDNSFSTLIIL